MMDHLKTPKKYIIKVSAINPYCLSLLQNERNISIAEILQQQLSFNTFFPLLKIVITEDYV